MSRKRTAQKAPTARKKFVEGAPHSALLFILGGIVVVLMAMFIFSNTNGDISVGGDDVWTITHSEPFSWNYFRLANRGYVVPFYSFIFDMNGQSTQNTHLFYFCLLVSSGLLFYFLLQKWLGAAPAAIGTIFYLGYIGKYETVTWMAAGGYLICANVLFLFVWIAISGRLGPWTKGGLIAGINWLAALFYELLIVVAPLYPLFYWLYSRLRRRPVALGAMAATCLPLVMFLGHVTVMYLSTPKDAPLPWQRGSTRAAMGLNAAAARVLPTLESGFSSGMGRQHFALLAYEIEGFRKYVPGNTYATLAALVGCAGVGVLLWLGPLGRPDNAVVIPLSIAGGYLALFSPLIGFTTISGFVPSRLLTLVGVGLALLIAVAASLAIASRMPIVRFGVPAVLLAVGVIEAAAMNSILYEHQTSWAYDSHIRNQLLATGIKPQIGDTIFISLPQHPLDGYWKVGFSHFENGLIQALLTADYGLLHEHEAVTPLFYEHEIRQYQVPPVKPVGQSGHKLFCFAVTDNDFRLIRTDCQPY